MTDPVSRSPLASLLRDSTVIGGLMFADLTLAPRAGLKGPGTRAWLENNGYGSLPPANLAVRRPPNVLVAMLGDNEALLLGKAGPVPFWLFASGAAIAPGVYPVPRAEGTFWIMISGDEAPGMFAKVCGVDVRPKSFKDLSVAQTIIARTSAVIVRDDTALESSFHVLGDISLGSYLVRQLMTAAASS